MRHPTRRTRALLSWWQLCAPGVTLLYIYHSSLLAQALRSTTSLCSDTRLLKMQATGLSLLYELKKVQTRKEVKGLLTDINKQQQQQKSCRKSDSLD